MTKLLSPWLKLGLRGRLLLLIVLMLCLGRAILGGAQMRWEIEDYWSALSRDMKPILDHMEDDLAGPVVAGDSGAIRRILVARLGQRRIEGIAWRDVAGAVMHVRAERPELPRPPSWFQGYMGLRRVVESRDIMVAGRDYGTVELEFSSLPLERELWREFVAEAWQFGLLLLLLVSAVFALLGKWLSPLERVAAAGRRFLAGDYSLRISDSSRLVPEIRTMVEILNQAAAQVGGLVLSLSEQRRAIDDAVIVIESDLNGVVFYVNDKFCEVSGYRRDEVIGKDHRFLKSGYHTREFFEDLWRAVKRGDTWQGEICNQTKGGGILWLLATITPVLGRDGKPFKYISVWVDITRRKLAENVLAQQAQIIDQIHDAVFSTDLDGTLVSWNKGAELLFGHSAHEAVGQPARFLVPAEERAAFDDRLFPNVLRDGGAALEMRLLKKSGQGFDAHCSLTLLRDCEGSPIGVAGYALDISAHKLMERALRESEARLAKAQQMARLGSWEWDMASDAIVRSPEVVRIFELEPDAGPNMAVCMAHVHPDDRDLVRQSLSAALAREITFSVDFRIITGGGTERVLHGEGEVEWDREGRPVRMIGTVQDITERKLAEQEVRQSREQLRELSSHLQTVREEEKAAIAREIHDELGGNLTALKMDIFWLTRKLPPELDAARVKVSDMANMVDASVHAMRRIVTELRPTVLDDLGLLPAMKWQASEFAKRYGIQCKVELHGDEIDMAEACRIALFRIFQEALTNAARYSKASQVQVEVWREHDKIALEILDNGIGIPEGAIMQPTSHGIRGMMERAHSLGGSVEIGSAPGEGVSISVRIPLSSVPELIP